jgi:hypothetical protein
MMGRRPEREPLLKHESLQPETKADPVGRGKNTAEVVGRMPDSAANQVSLKSSQRTIVPMSNAALIGSSTKAVPGTRAPPGTTMPGTIGIVVLLRRIGSRGKGDWLRRLDR